MALDAGKTSVLTLLDLSSAFDTIDHAILLQRLSAMYGISGTAIKWFESYLSDRTQYVTVDGTDSEPTPLMFGVPQGSVLGPVLFILYTKPLSSLIGSLSVNNQSYADDTQMYKSCERPHLQTAIATTENCFTETKLWMTDNKLKLNDDKTEVLLVRASQWSDLDPNLTSIKIGNTRINFAETAKNLGFIVSALDLNLQSHVSSVCSSTNYEIRKIAAVRKFLSVNATKKLVSAFVLSRLDFSNALLSGCDKYLTNRLQIVQNSAARLIAQSRRRTSISPFLRDFHWLKVEERIEYKLCCLCFNFFTGDCPSYFSSLLTKYECNRPGNRSDSDNRLLRSYARDVNTVKYGQRTFSFCATSAWNSLPYAIRHKSSVSSFKTALKTHLFHKSHP